MKSARAAPTTLAAKSGFVSRSRNWAMFAVAPTSSADFCCSGV